MTKTPAAIRDIEHTLHGFVELNAHRENGSTVITGGKGVWVFDEKGTPYLEGAAGMWCASLGFGEQALMDAANEQFAKLPYYHSVAFKTTHPAIDLAERLATRVPIKNAKVNFCLSGSEANDFLVKIVRFYNNAIGRPRKKKIIARVNGYHGATLMATSLTGITANHAGFDLPLPGVLHVSDPKAFSNALSGETEADFAARLCGELEEKILQEGPDTVAAFIAEPVTGAGGVVIPPAGYYEGVQQILKRYDVLFLADEVITGFCRTGKYWGSTSMGMTPNTMTLAKGLTSAYQPLAAIVLSDEIYRGLELGSANLGWFGHGTTYAGHPVGCAVALKVMELIEERGIEAHVARVAQTFSKRLDVLRDLPFVGDVRSIGLMGAVEFVVDKKTKTPFNPKGSFAKALKERAEQKYHLICRTLAGGDSCAFSPPLIITEEEINEMFDRFTKALADVAAGYMH
ncbi:aminotransferase class III-fold pyridoxal phosphate-dependent enzyme [Paraburkholderia madseniana]|uniref:Aminotransferase class III-fold pyridoxal phosphate-dependent enzyme n=1 Tax=Paraburkholderia madseniana TaxID=2599607 RepID=A0A6N6W7P0_9BURK|nr:aminotransferase [Paraburkholderia madseniana]KAE8755979.1 aminotransferase class III-fold pyridoxal phosphate-dependent enzyme [Paraburkholderia madseniana]